MSNLRQAAQDVLELVEWIKDNLDVVRAGGDMGISPFLIDKLRAALAEPEQEPVPWEQFYPDIGKPQTTHWEGCEAVHPECRAKTELERKSDAIQRLWKERDELRTLNAELVKALKHAAECVQTNYLPDKCGHDWDDVIAKAEASNGS